MACILKSSLLWLDSPMQESERGDRQGAMHSLSTGRPLRPDGSRDPQRPTRPGAPTTPARVGAVPPRGEEMGRRGRGPRDLGAWGQEACGQDEDVVSMGRWVWRRLPG